MSAIARQSWSQSPAVAHTAPLVVFMLLTELANVVRVENSALPWYQSAPEHWVYPLQCLIVGTLLLLFRHHYTLKPWRGLGLAALLAVVGIAVWVLPASLYHEGQPSWREWLGIAARDKGFDPNVFKDLPSKDPMHEAIYRTEAPAWCFHSPAWFTTVTLRFFRMVVIVPFVEELFWRGFLMRYVQADGRPFLTVPFGRHTWRAFWIVTVAVTLVHQPEDYLGAFVWGSLTYWLAVRTKSLGACVFMHAVGNGLLGIYVMATERWGFW